MADTRDADNKQLPLPTGLGKCLPYTLQPWGDVPLAHRGTANAHALVLTAAAKRGSLAKHKVLRQDLAASGCALTRLTMRTVENFDKCCRATLGQSISRCYS